jgi:hypothetical protein
MQNIKVRKFRLFPNKRAMAWMVYGYLAWFALSALLIPGFVFAMTGNLLFAIAFALSINALFVWLPSLVLAYRIGVLADAVKGLLPFLLLPYLNLFLYCRAAVRELVLNQTLTVWKKGH